MSGTLGSTFTPESSNNNEIVENDFENKPKFENEKKQESKTILAENEAKISLSRAHSVTSEYFDEVLAKTDSTYAFDRNILDDKVESNLENNSVYGSVIAKNHLLSLIQQMPSRYIRPAIVNGVFYLVPTESLLDDVCSTTTTYKPYGNEVNGNNFELSHPNHSIVPLLNCMRDFIGENEFDRFCDQYQIYNNYLAANIDTPMSNTELLITEYDLDTAIDLNSDQTTNLSTESSLLQSLILLNENCLTDVCDLDTARECESNIDLYTPNDKLSLSDMSI